MLDSSSSIRETLASARHDIKTFHDSRSLITKAISEWEVKFLHETGRHANPEESETSVGYMYEMLDKLQLDLQDRMTSVMELTAKFRMMQQELLEIEEPIAIARDRSIRGTSPIPREVAEKFLITDPSFVSRDVYLDPHAVLPTLTKSNSSSSPSSSHSLPIALGFKSAELAARGRSRSEKPVIASGGGGKKLDSTGLATFSSSSFSATPQYQGDYMSSAGGSAVELPQLNSTPLKQRPLSGLEPPSSSTYTPNNPNQINTPSLSSPSPIHTALFGAMGTEGSTPSGPITREANLLKNRGSSRVCSNTIILNILF